MAAPFLSASSSYITPARQITEKDIGVFGALTGTARGGEGEFRGIIAHALLVLSCGIELAMPEPSRVIALRSLRDVVFKRPIKPGDSIRVALRVDAITPLPERRELVSMTWKILNESNATVARACADFVCSCAADQPCGRDPEEDLEALTVALIPV